MRGSVLVGTNRSSQNPKPCWLVVTGLIILALNPFPVDEQPVASTTVTPSTTASNADCVICFKKTPEQWSVSKLSLLERQTSLTMCVFIFIQLTP
jgi:hypothetical protein